MVEQKSPDIHKRLIAFLEKYPNRKITSVIIPPSLSEIPDIIRPLIDLQKIMYTNAAPLYILLKSLGIGVSEGKTIITLSDMYNIKY